MLSADSLQRDVSIAALVTLASIALGLDLVDGRVARRTNTVSELGARMDGEVDAFLILALSVAVAPSVGGWVLAIGAARYAFLAAGWLVAWMRAPLPRRDWRKVVAATQGITLTVAAARILPLTLTRAMLAVALCLLAESFGRDVWWLWRHRQGADSASRGRAIVLTSLALVVVWAALVAPTQPWRLTPGAFARLPIEGIVVVALAVVLPGRARRLVPWVIGPVLGLLSSMKLDDPDFLGGVEWLQFGRMRIAHVNNVIFAAFTPAMMGMLCHAVPRLTGRPLVGVRAAWAALVILSIALPIGLCCLLGGYLQPIEAGEFPMPVDIMITIVFLKSTVRP